MKLNMLGLALILGIMLPGFAQQSSEGKIKIEISKQINGERKTFKGEYNSTEEMRADPSYQEFAGKEEDFDFSFDGAFDEDQISIHLDQLKGLSKSFNADEDDNFFFKHLDGSEEGSFFFKHFDGDSLEQVLDFDGNDFEEFNEKMKDLGIEFEELFDKINDENSSHRVKIIAFKKVVISDVEGNEFGKKGKVAESNILELDDLDFSPNPSSSGRFKVRFSVPEEEELSIKVYNLEGKEIYNRYFERFGGTYSETIDLSDQEKGIYLLEIMQSNKRVTKKVAIK